MFCAELLSVMAYPLNMAVVFPASCAAFFPSPLGVVGVSQPSRVCWVLLPLTSAQGSGSRCLCQAGS